MSKCWNDDSAMWYFQLWYQTQLVNHPRLTRNAANTWVCLSAIPRGTINRPGCTTGPPPEGPGKGPVGSQTPPTVVFCCSKGTRHHIHHPQAQHKQKIGHKFGRWSVKSVPPRACLRVRVGEERREGLERVSLVRGGAVGLDLDLLEAARLLLPRRAAPLAVVEHLLLRRDDAQDLQRRRRLVRLLEDRNAPAPVALPVKGAADVGTPRDVPDALDASATRLESSGAEGPELAVLGNLTRQHVDVQVEVPRAVAT